MKHKAEDLAESLFENAPSPSGMFAVGERPF
jgi:hypothetical protein